MSWQDVVISIANIAFSISLIVQVYYGFKEKVGPIKFFTSIPTCIGLFAVSVAFWTLGLYFSTVIAFCNGILWLLLCVQRFYYNRATRG
jgi:hypothetical protein